MILLNDYISHNYYRIILPHLSHIYIAFLVFGIYQITDEAKPKGNSRFGSFRGLFRTGSAKSRSSHEDSETINNESKVCLGYAIPFPFFRYIHS